MPRLVVACDACDGEGVVEGEDCAVECRVCEGAGKLAVEDSGEDAAYDEKRAYEDLPL